MRRRPGAGIRIVTHCARCDASRGRVAMREVVVLLPVDGVKVRHELAVCSACDRRHTTTPTWLEAEALAVDVADPVACQRFYDQQRRDAQLLQRTARFFLGDAATDALLAEWQQARAGAAAQEEWEGEDDWRERARRREWSDLYGDEHEEEVPF